MLVLRQLLLVLCQLRQRCASAAGSLCQRELEILDRGGARDLR